MYVPSLVLPWVPHKQVVRCLVALGIIVPTSDTLSVKRAIAFFLETINRQAEAKEAVAVGLLGTPW